MRRTVLLAVAVLAAMAVGRVITDSIPVLGVAEAPFVRHGHVGRSVHLSYADVTVTGVRGAKRLEGVDVAVPGGKFLVVDTTLRATHETTTLLGVWLLDRAGHRYVPMNRGTTCGINATLPAGVTWYAMWCFDVPARAIRGAQLVIARGEYGSEGSDVRRDDLAQVDLGIGATKARTIAGATEVYRATQPGLDPPDLTPLKPAKGSS